MEALLDQLSNPVAAAAVGFIAGGIFTALVDLAGRELSAYIDDRRRRAREKRELLVARLRVTQAYLAEFVENTALRAAGLPSKEHDPVKYIGVRMGLVGDVALLQRLERALTPLLHRPAEPGLSQDEYVELVGAREACANALERQEDLVLDDKPIQEIPRETVDEIVSMTKVVSAWRDSAKSQGRPHGEQ